MPDKQLPLDERFFLWLTRAPGRTLAVLALIWYPGIGLALPLLTNQSQAWFLAMNLWGVGVAALVSLGWFVGKIQAGHRRHLIEWTTNLRLLNATEFEWLVGELFRREGWRVTETGGRGRPDGNVDLRLVGATGARAVVQCKRWLASDVGVDEIRAFAGTLLREGLAGSAGHFVTLGAFTEAARAEGTRIGLHLIDGDDLYPRLVAVRRAEHCPACHSPMVLGRSSRGWWLRCVQPGCSGKRDLGRDEARAIELLVSAPD